MRNVILAIRHYDWQEWAHRLLARFGALCLVALGIVFCASFIGFNPADPSFNTASSLPVENYAGLFGSYSADLLLQTLGVAAFALPLLCWRWAWVVWQEWELPQWQIRVFLSLLALPLLALAFSALPFTWAWLPSANFGGGVGMVLGRGLYQLLSPVLGWGAGVLIGTLALVSSIVCLLPASLLRVADIRDGIDNVRETIAEFIGHLRGEETAHDDDDDEDEYEEDEEDEEERPAAARNRRKPKIAEAPKSSRRAKRVQEPELDFENGEYDLPPVDLLHDVPPVKNKGISKDALQNNASLLLNVLNEFGVKGEIVAIHPGPVVTLYELEPAAGIKSARVIGLADDIARSMSAVSVRVAVVPGRNVIGIEMPNAKRETVFMRDLLETDIYADHPARLALILGKDIGGQPIIADLAKMPHLLVAGTTGSGKSVAVNTMILSLLYRLTPDQCRLIMIDPKMLELSVYEGIPHLLSPVVTEPKKAIVALKWTVREMENRYRAMSKLGVRNIDGYNVRVREARDKGEQLTRRVQTGFDADTGKPIYEEEPMNLNDLPYIVVIVDEFADLMLVAGKEIEAAIQRLAQMARAAGIHLIMATQRPSVDVITGTIKANFPTRISFQVTSKIDSRTILQEGGAEQLLGQGDMLYMAAGGRITRVHGPFVRDDEVERVVEFLKEQGPPSYLDEVTEEEEESEEGEEGEESGVSDDPLFDEAVSLVARERKASTSFLQRHLQIGYNRAARIMDVMEREGMVSPANAVGKREILLRDAG